MDFKQTVKAELDEKYIHMLDYTTPIPYKTKPQINEWQRYRYNNRNYYDRLEFEKTDFNNACAEIKRRQSTRIDKESQDFIQHEINSASKKISIKKTLITALFIFPAVLFLIWAIFMIKSPLTAFSLIHFGWAIAFFVIMVIVYLSSAFIIMLKHIEFNVYAYYERYDMPYKSFNADNHKDCKGKWILIHTRNKVSRIILAIIIPITSLVLMIIGMSICNPIVKGDNQQLEKYCKNLPSITIELSTSEDMELLKKYKDFSFVLGNDIDFYGETWECDKFSGKIDGCNHTIKNIVFHRCGQFGGLFSELTNGEIRNLTLENISYNLDYDDYYYDAYFGAIAGYASDSYIENVKTSGEVTGYYYASRYSSGSNCHIGGIVGMTYSTIKNSENRINFNVSGGHFMGGIVGYGKPSIIACNNYGNISGKSNMGGILGYCDGYSVGKILIDCNNYGAISGSYSVGGIVGREPPYENIRTNCINNGTVNEG